VKRILLLILVIVLGIGMVIMGCGGAPPAEEEEEEEEEQPRQEIVLDFASFWGATDFQYYGFKDWAKSVSDLVIDETTQWKMKFNWYAAVSPPALRTGVQTGTYDIVTAGPGYYAGVYPTWSVAEQAADTNVLPRKNALTMSMAVQALWDDPASTALRDEFAAVEPNCKVMFYWSTGPGYFLMVEGKQVRTLEDFPGKKIRSANPASNCAITALGGTPVAKPMSAALEAFQSGTIDGILCPTDTPKGFGLSAYVRQLTVAPISYQFVFWQLINKDTWNSLPAEVQNIMTRVNKQYTEYFGKLRTWGELDGLGFCRQLGWNTTWFEYDLPNENPTEYARWLAAIYPSCVNEWIAGNATRQALWDKFVQLQKYYTNTDPWKSWSPGSLGGPPSYASPPPPTPPTTFP